MCIHFWDSSIRNFEGGKRNTSCRYHSRIFLCLIKKIQYEWCWCSLLIALAIFSVDFQNLWKSRIFVILSIHNPYKPSLGSSCEVQQKIGPDLFRRFNVYRLQTNKQASIYGLQFQKVDPDSDPKYCSLKKNRRKSPKSLFTTELCHKFQQCWIFCDWMCYWENTTRNRISILYSQFYNALQTQS